MLCLGRFQKGRPFLVLFWIFALLRIFQIASLAFFALLPFATACQILGTFEKFPESLPAESARFQPIAALLELDALGMCHPARASGPPQSVSSGNLRSSVIVIVSRFRLSRRSPRVLGTTGPISNRMSRWYHHHTDRPPQRRRPESGRYLGLSPSHF